MAFTWQDFLLELVNEYFSILTPQEQQEVLNKLPLETRIAGLSEKQIREYLDQMPVDRKPPTRKPRRKK